jgi:hypothetical protein
MELDNVSGETDVATEEDLIICWVGRAHEIFFEF